MKKILKLALACSFFTLSTVAFSFSETISIENVFSSITEYKVTSGDFSQEKTSAKIKRPLKSSGKFIFSQEGIVWQTLKPFPSTTTVTKDALIQVGADGKKSVIDGESNETFKTVAATLTSIFGGKKADLEQYFIIKKFDSNDTSWNLLLTPKDATISSTLKEINLSGTVKASKATLDEMSILQNESDSTKYKLSNQTHKQELSVNEKAFFQK